MSEEPELNFVITGDEARYLMLVLQGSNVAVPTAVSIQLYLRLSNIAQVQPPKQSS